jgi:hypothetical protein
MAIITMPDNNFRDAQWSLEIPQQVNRSAWTGRRTTMRLPGASRWHVSATHRPIIGEAAFRPWKAFLTNLRGTENSFQMIAVEKSQRTGSNPTVSGSPAVGAISMTLNGLTVSTTNLTAGHMMTVVFVSGKSQLVVLTADLVANGSGVGTANFLPELREAGASATIEAALPYANVILDDPTTSYSVQPGQIYSIGLTATELL